VFVAFSVLTLVTDVHRDRWANAVLAGVNAVLAGYAIVAYVGVRNSLVDIWNNVLSWLYKPQRPARTKRVARRAHVAVAVAAAEAPAAHWSQTLVYASPDGVRRAERRTSSRRNEFGGDRRSPLGDRRAGPPDDQVDRRAPSTAPAAESEDRR
jgi:hypothetical protein